MSKRNIYFDHAATTPLHPKVLEKMLPFLKEEFGNPSSIHGFGRKVRVAIEEARETIADFINASPSEIYFVSGGTEANNFPLFGISKTEFTESSRNEIITTKAEHKCVLEPLQELCKSGFVVKQLDVINDSSIDLEILKENLNEKTSLVSVIHINNETGTENNIKQIAEVVHQNKSFFHTDAVQSFGKIPIDAKNFGIDSLSISAHKLNGPKGVGAVYAKSGTPLSPIIFGGSQERNRRGGTENSAAIVGFAEAVKIARTEMQNNFEAVNKLREHFICGIQQLDSTGIEINGIKNNFPFILSITFKNEFYNNDAEAILMYLDINGIAASNGAACTSGTLKPSHVILAMGKSVEDANGTIRFSFGAQNTFEEVDYAIEVLNYMKNKFRI
ncbi:MAG: cysteine desulfurase family protein [Ignavibacteriales bacterium]|nr:cysteine desulfurase family protein [Ignavibacteriales bacterium]